MTEIFTEITDDFKSLAENTWNLALTKGTPSDAAKFLNEVIEYYRIYGTQEQVDFLQLYFKMQMEMI